MKTKSKQRGASLLVSLVMLILLTLFVISAVRTSTTNLRVTGNTQTQTEALTSAQHAIEEVLNKDFTLDPLAVSATPVNVDVHNDGANDYTVNLEAICLNADPIKMADLDAANEADRYCYQGGAEQNTGIVNGTPSIGSSVCNATQWDITARVEDPSSGAKMEVHQGVSKRVGIDVECPT